LGADISAVGTTTFRPPYTPLTFGTIAGRDIGALADPVRMTPIHSWHLANGARFEDVGQWKRPWYYARPGESIQDAVNRECLATRQAIGVLDASTLGKIDIQGPDTAEFLNRVYTNGWKMLELGRCRYGVMCGEDGMVFDDGVTTRLGEHHYWMTTTSGNAARVLAWLEEWLQTEWPELKVYCNSMTEHWATIGIAGPFARQFLSKLTDDIDLDPKAFPFGAGFPHFIHRRVFLRDQRAGAIRFGAMEHAHDRRRTIRDHAYRYREHACAARREGVLHSRSGHRWDRNAHRSGYGLDCEQTKGLPG
jgi:sarcosine oxidase subunit alpha